MAIQDQAQPRSGARRYRPPAPPLPAGIRLPETGLPTGTDRGSDGLVEWLAPAMAANGIGGFDWDIRTDRLAGDERALRITGLRRGEAGTGGAFLDRLQPDDAAMLRRRIGRAIRDLGQCGAYYRAVAPDGEVHAVRFRARVVADEEGNPARLIGFVWDATAEMHKRQREDRLAELREERSRFVKEAAQRLSEAVTVPDVARIFTGLPLPGIPPYGMMLCALEGGRLKILDVMSGSGGSGAAAAPATAAPAAASAGAAGDAQAVDAASSAETLVAEQERLERRRRLLGPGTRQAAADAVSSPAAQAISSRSPVFLSSPEEFAERFPAAWEELSQGPGGPGHRAWVYLPLVASGRVIGVCVVAFDDDHEPDSEERTLLTTLGGLVAQSLARARLHDAELEFAAGLQRVLLPRRLPPIPGVAAAVRYLPAGSGLQIGGDWYDVVPLPGGHVGLVIGDVQGHDVSAAGVMGQLRIAMRAYAAEGHPPAAVMARASRFLADLDTGHFATCTYLEVNVDYGAVQAVRAGHLEPLVRRANGSCAAQPVAGGLPLGIAPEEEYPVTRFTLDPGELLLLCTDGLVESRTVDQDEGMERLRALLAAHGGAAASAAAGPRPLEALADALLESGGPHARDDDIALLLMRWDGPAEGRPSRMLRRVVPQADLARISELRAELRGAAERWGVGDLADTAELLVSELVTNALVHTDRDAVFTARLYGGPIDGAAPGAAEGTREVGPARLRVEVEDESDQWPQRRTPGEQASSGRGLLLVEALADDWGVEPRGAGKRMWFELVAEAQAEG